MSDNDWPCHQRTTDGSGPVRWTDKQLLNDALVTLDEVSDALNRWADDGECIGCAMVTIGDDYPRSEHLSTCITAAVAKAAQRLRVHRK